MLQAQVINKSPDQRPFPDVILKSQFFDTIGKRSLTSEQRLMLAVLADAINLVQDGKLLAVGKADRLKTDIAGDLDPLVRFMTAGFGRRVENLEHALARRAPGLDELIERVRRDWPCGRFRPIRARLRVNVSTRKWRDDRSRARWHC